MHRYRMTFYLNVISILNFKKKLINILYRMTVRDRVFLKFSLIYIAVFCIKLLFG